MFTTIGFAVLTIIGYELVRVVVGLVREMRK